MTAPVAEARGLGQDCIRMALQIIESDGLERLSLRDVARRLGVSHQAPYKHFASRDHLLAAVVASLYSAFAAHLDARPAKTEPYDDLREIGRAYLGYAAAHPLNYRLMFGTPLPAPDDHPAMMARAQHAFSILQHAIARLPGPGGGPRPSVDADALYVWSTMHGFASMLQSSAIGTLSLEPSVTADLEAHLFERLGAALSAPVGEPSR